MPSHIQTAPQTAARVQTARATLLHPVHFFTALLLAAAMFLAQALAVEARGAPESFASLVEKVSPAVVNITTSSTVATSTDEGGDGQATPFDELFRDFLNRRNGTRPPRHTAALGSGFIVSADGYIVTNNHVIDGADEIKVEFFAGGDAIAKVIGTDPKTDIALLKVDVKKDLPFVEFGDSDVAKVGDWVMAVGNPLGQGFSVSAGIISARNRALRGSYDDFIQTDAAINRGNSGGPLFNMDGQVIGVNTAILSPNGGGSIGIGFSMSSAVVSHVVQQLKEFGETRRGWLGVRIQDVNGDLADTLGLPEPKGAMITELTQGPAKAAGIKQGDVIVTFDGKPVADSRELVRTVADTDVGKKVEVEVFRDGKMVTLEVVLARREEAEAASAAPAVAPPPVDHSKVLLGLKLSPLTEEIRKELKLKPEQGGVAVLDVDDLSQAYDKGLRAGDVITEAGQVKVSNPKDFSDRLEQAREAGRTSILLLVRRGNDPRFVALSLD